MSVNLNGRTFGVSAILCLIATIIFVLAGFGVNVSDSVDNLELVAFGLAVFAAAHLLP